MAASFEALARARGKLLSRGEAGAGRVRGDAAKLELAAACLVSNLVMHGSAEAALSAWRGPEGGIVIEARDDGQGVAAEASEAAFRAFSHAGALRTRRADGLGLGLPMTRRLAALHGGAVTLSREGGGFSARIVLPPHRSL